ncbi:DNA-directed RNA polymerase subunit alpha, partial [Candidatus Parcubacteria bacterium]|nr:DNA-directed RNA polymerase subunit alpha [Candidatus Parcubacteria bacterium]
GKSEIGTIFVDAIFSPIKKVAMKVEKMRVGKRTDFDKLRLEIETDGTISPLEAFKQACQILIEQVAFLKEKIYEEKKKT